MSPQRILLLVGCLTALAVCAHSRSVITDDSEIFEVHHLGKRASKKCMGELGCFEITKDFFHPLYRPINVLPADRESINTQFLLYTRKNSKQPEKIKANKKDIDKSYFSAARNTKFLVHGWFDNQFFGKWMTDMMKEFLLHDDYNIIVVDWSGGNKLPYTKATANTRVVGAEIALLVNFLANNYELDPNSVHLLGHSLGAHIVGYAGERLKTLGRITAMDPAEPYFQNLPATVRIDPTDALFVDVIHTDSKSILKLGLGMSQLCGHVDFFPNDGNNHPGCSLVQGGLKILTEGLVEATRRFVACNHQRAVDFLTDSINDHECRQLAFACPDWNSFKDGRCSSCGVKGENCAIMGINAIDYQPFVKGNESKKFYTITGSKSPYCTFMYQVQVKLQNSKGKSRKGSMKMTIRGSKRTETFNVANGNVDLYPGATYNHLLTTSQNLGEIESISFTWDRSTWVIGSIIKHYIYVEDIKITTLNEPNMKIREEVSRKFCVKEKGELQSGKSLDLLPTTKAVC